jgi:DNA polymerase
MSEERPVSGGAATHVVVQRLESLAQAGVTFLPKSRHKNVANRAGSPTTSPPAAIGAVARASGSTAITSLGPPEARQPTASLPASVISSQLIDGDLGAPVVPAAERPTLLDIIRGEVAGCTRCSDLVACRSQTVFGVGNPNARLMFIGEAPGADEDRQGEPFVGRAGQLLTRIIEACRLRREEVYIANVLKCRPPSNRTPLPDEVLNCRGYLERQIAIIRPEMICCVGVVAAQAILNTTVPIGRLRGKFHDYQGVPVVCTYHPAYLLRNPDAKRFVWDDMKMLMRRMGVEL